MKLLQFATCALALVSTTTAAPARAGDQVAVPAATVDLAPVQVGVKSPPMWLFSKDGKRLIVLGTQLPLPESGVLVTGSVRDYIRQSEVVLTGPGLRTGDGVGMLKGLTLVSSMRNAQKNPGGRTLSEVVPAQTYDKWVVLKARYIGKDAGVEKQRPMYAAYALYSAALKQHGLTDVPSLGAVIAKATRDSGLERLDARYSLPNDNLRRTLKEFDVAADADAQCLDRTLDVLQAYLEFAPVAAEAWAAGDIQRYRDAEQRYVPIEGCWARLTNEAMARSSGVDDPYANVDATWLAAVRNALRNNATVFSTLPARDLINATGLAKALRDDGFAVTPLFTDVPTQSGTSTPDPRTAAKLAKDLAHRH